MKYFLLLSMMVAAVFGPSAISAQGYVRLLPEKTVQINGYSVNYIYALRKTRKGEDYYRITVSVTNDGQDILQLFTEATRSFDQTHYPPLAYFQFMNATGRGLSATSGKIYPRPLTINVPYACRKCPPPTDSKKDPYNHYTSSYYIGIQFRSGQTITKSYDIRVPHGDYPAVRVLVQ